MLLRQFRNSPRRIAEGARSALKQSSPTIIIRQPRITNPIALQYTIARTYAQGRPHPPGGTHRINLGSEEEKSALDQYGVDLTARARAGKLDPVIGRDAEIHRTIQVLSRRTKNNPVLIGSAG
jgi:ATP-dependent Clp protease ATP-binding subunit ClpB